MRCLLLELRERIEHPLHDSSIGNIGPTLRVLDESDVAVKLGFSRPPFTYFERPHPGHDYARGIFVDEPDGGGGEMLLSAPLAYPTLKGTERIDLTWSRSKGDERKTLLQVIDRWIAALGHLVEPKIYPNLPPFIPNADAGLARDPLWRRLTEARTMLGGSAGRQLLVEEPIWWTRLNRLMSEVGLGQGVLLLRSTAQGTVTEWILFSPNSSTPKRIPSPEGGAFTENAASTLSGVLDAWAKERAAQLRPRAAGAGSPRPGKPRGRPQQSNPSADAALVKLWRAAKADGRSLKQFEEGEGVKRGEVRRASDRLRAATRRGE